MTQVKYAAVDGVGNIIRTGTCVPEDIALQAPAVAGQPAQASVEIPPEAPAEIYDTSYRYENGQFTQIP